MRRTISSLAVVAACLCWAGSASAAGSYTLCSTGPGRPVVSPQRSGSCARGQGSIKLASAGTASSLQKQVSTLKRQNRSLQNQVEVLNAQVAILNGYVDGQFAVLNTQVATLQDTFSGVSRNGNTLQFSGMNLQLLSGSGKTGAVNGLGNLIIGYNEKSRNRSQTGSHNLVLGNDQTFTSYGGIIAGQNNTLSSPYSSVTGGAGNTASGNYSSVTGGYGNTASGNSSSVTGGIHNTASGNISSILGGHHQTLATTCGTIPTGAATC